MNTILWAALPATFLLFIELPQIFMPRAEDDIFTSRNSSTGSALGNCILSSFPFSHGKLVKVFVLLSFPRPFQDSLTFSLVSKKIIFVQTVLGMNNVFLSARNDISEKLTKVLAKPERGYAEMPNPSFLLTFNIRLNFSTFSHFPWLA